MANRNYLSVTETAKILRKELRAAFPNVKFYVQKSGNSIRVKWVDGPTESEVDAVSSMFAGEGFDGMIDMRYSIDAYVKNGRIVGTRSSGTVGSGGAHSAHDDAIEGAELVHFLSSFIFTERIHSIEHVTRVVTAVAMATGEELPEIVHSDAYITNTKTVPYAYVSGRQAHDNQIMFGRAIRQTAEGAPVVLFGSVLLDDYGQTISEGEELVETSEGDIIAADTFSAVYDDAAENEFATVSAGYFAG